MISVVMGVSKIDAYLPLAIGSVLAQSFKRIELILVANGTQADSIVEYLKKEYSVDQRVRILKSQIPQLAYILNIGIDAASYDLVGRMDADDVAQHNWLSELLAFMRSGDFDMVGCNLRLIDAHGDPVGIRRYPRGKQINRTLPFKNCFAHNTVIMRKSALIAVRGYNAGFNSEDYDLWLRMRRTGTKWDNLDKCLVDYRLHDGASQRRLLGYAEAAGLAVREFILHKTLTNFSAAVLAIAKSFFRSR